MNAPPRYCSERSPYRTASRLAPMSGGHQRGRLVRALPTSPPAVPAVFRREHQSAAVEIVVAVWPAVVGATVDANEHLSRVRGALRGREELGPIVVELVAAVDGRVEVPIERIARERDRISQSGGKASPSSRPLAEAVRIECNSARSEAGARINPESFASRCCRGSTRTDVDVEDSPMSTKLCVVRARHRPPVTCIRLSKGESTGRETVANDRVAHRRVHEIAVDRDARSAVAAEALLHVGLAVTIGVAQRDDRSCRARARTARSSRLRVDEDVAVRRDDNVPHPWHPLSEHRGAEPGRKLEARRATGRSHSVSSCSSVCRSREQRSANRRSFSYGMTLKEASGQGKSLTDGSRGNGDTGQKAGGIPNPLFISLRRRAQLPHHLPQRPDTRASRAYRRAPSFSRTGSDHFARIFHSLPCGRDSR